MSIKLMKFGAEWCQPCKMLKPIIEKLEQEMPEVEFVDIDIDTEQELSTKYHIRSIPTLILFKDGEPTDQLTGLYDYNTIKEFIEGLA